MSGEHPTGTLLKTPLAHLLVYSYAKRVSGTLVLTCPDGESATVTIEEGHVAKVRTSQPVAFLGMVLYERGIISDVELNASLAEVASRRVLHGRILLDRQSITRDQLCQALHEQALRKLAYLFGFPPETAFTFQPDTDLLSGYGADDLSPIDPLPAIWRGIREYPSEEHLRTVIGRVGGQRFVLVKGAQPDRFDLEDDLSAVVELLRYRPMTVSELAAVRSLGQRRAELLVYCLLITKQAELTQASPQQPSLPPRQSLPGMAGASRMRPVSFIGRAAPPVTLPPGWPLSAPPPRVGSTAPMTSISVPAPPPAAGQGSSSDELAHRRQTIPVRPHAQQEEDDLAASGHPDAFSGARACFARGDLERAERLSRRANREEPANADALALLAWVEALNPNNQGTEATRKRIAMLSRAIDLDDHCENAVYWRAQLYKRTENHPAAIRDFKRVIALNEEHVDAVRELRIYEMRVRHKSITIRTNTPSGGVRKATPSGFLAKRPA
jgi:hypothetical protein